MKIKPAVEEEQLKYVSQSVQRAIDVLLAFTDEESEWGITELSDALNIPKSAVHRTVVNLEMRSLLERNPVSKKYRLGLRAFEVGMRARRCTVVQQVARPLLEELAHQTGETASLAILSGAAVLLLDTVESSRALRAALPVGQRRPVHCSSVGKALIAWLPDHEVNRIVEETGLTRYTPNTITDVERLHQELAAVRKRGYALDMEEFEEDLRCVGAPIWDDTGTVLASISISGPIGRFDSSTLPDLIGVVRATALAVSRKMGYSGLPSLTSIEDTTLVPTS